jgi:polyphosphate kinase 2 (PPK2 family)
VLVVRVHPEVLAAQNLPRELVDDQIWKKRFESFVAFERHLYRNGTRVIKFYLHLSKEEQRKRLLARIEDREKNWKFSATDIEERKRWGDYMSAYEDCLSATSTRHAPWYIIPADDKRNARLIVSQAILDTIGELNPKYPQITGRQKQQLQAFRRVLTRK